MIFNTAAGYCIFSQRVDILNLAVTLSMAAAPFLVLFNQEVIQHLKEERAPPPFDRIDDVAASVPAAERERRHFPQVPVYARAHRIGVNWRGFSRIWGS
ncbi:MAG: hypothetical protein ACYDB9_07805 [Gammaproteobacteria bacterium]